VGVPNKLLHERIVRNNVREAEASRGEFTRSLTARWWGTPPNDGDGRGLVLIGFSPKEVGGDGPEKRGRENKTW